MLMDGDSTILIRRKDHTLFRKRPRNDKLSNDIFFGRSDIHDEGKCQAKCEEYRGTESHETEFKTGTFGVNTEVFGVLRVDGGVALQAVVTAAPQYVQETLLHRSSAQRIAECMPVALALFMPAMGNAVP